MAIDLYERAKGSDRPDISNPHPSMKWTVVEAPKVSQCFHASAVLFDALYVFSVALALPLIHRPPVRSALADMPDAGLLLVRHSASRARHSVTAARL